MSITSWSKHVVHRLFLVRCLLGSCYRWPIHLHLSLKIPIYKNPLTIHNQSHSRAACAFVANKEGNWDNKKLEYRRYIDIARLQPLIVKTRLHEPKHRLILPSVVPISQTRHAYFGSNIQPKIFEKYVNLYTTNEPSPSEEKTTRPHDEHFSQSPRSDVATEIECYSEPFQESSPALPAKQLEVALSRQSSSQDLLYSLYCEIPSPGVAYMGEGSIRKLLKLLFSTEDANEAVMLRYLTILDDMIAAGKPLLRSEWTSAMVLTKRCVRRITAAEVETVLHLWRRMEQEANVEPSEVTFNVLFDAAAKAGKFALAEVLFEEMKKRKLRLNRQSHTGYILYQGLRGDGEGVKGAYKELVKAGEIVDTIVLNCVITSLIAVGEISAAELVFQRMKALHFSKPNARLPPKQRQHAKDLCSLLNAMALKCRDDVVARQEAQGIVPVAPNSETFRILVKYYAFKSGNLDRMTELIGEMYQFSLPIDRTIFHSLFKGFQKHGGVRYSAWTKARLEGLWTSYKDMLALDPDLLAVQRSFATTVLLAFKKCTGDSRTREIWEELLELWQPEQDDVDFTVDRLGL